MAVGLTARSGLSPAVQGHAGGLACAHVGGQRGTHAVLALFTDARVLHARLGEEHRRSLTLPAVMQAT